MEYIMLDAYGVKVRPPIQFSVMISSRRSHETYRVKEYVMMDALRVRATPPIKFLEIFLKFTQDMSRDEIYVMMDALGVIVTPPIQFSVMTSF